MAVLQYPTTAAGKTGDAGVTPIEARLHLAAIIESSDDAIISKDLTGVMTSWNAAATRVFGYTPEEAVGQSVLLIIPPELHWQEPEILRKVAAGERIEHFETKRRRKDGELIDISLTISPIRDNSGKIIGISKIARDITERKQAEAALFESERMAAIGRMAASIAHEVNNPLEAILNLGYLIAQNESLDQEGRVYAKLLLDEVLRVSEITKQTLAFYRDTSNATEIDVSSLMDSVLKFHGPLLEQKSIRIYSDLRPGASMWGRPGDLRQVFTNLILNAADAMPSGGKLRAAVYASTASDSVCASIADTGVGIPEAVRDRIFDPFFSTKSVKGTGLGLWVTQGIIRKYGGSIRMRTCTDPGTRRGTIFRLCLPVRG